MSAEPRVLFRRVRLDPVRALATRVGIALAALAAVALVTYMGRNGYRDALHLVLGEIIATVKGDPETGG